jgi:hypothetical protein
LSEGATGLLYTTFWLLPKAQGEREKTSLLSSLASVYHGTHKRPTSLALVQHSLILLMLLR